jgi:hypothetical protein
MNPFIIAIYNFINLHPLGCAFVAATFVASLPKPGAPWTLYEVIYKFLNGIAANLPEKKSVVQTETVTANGTVVSKTNVAVDMPPTNLSPLVEGK